MTDAILLAATLLFAQTNATDIRRRFLAVDDGTHTLHYVDQTDPAKNWRVPFGNYCMDMQLIGNGRVLLAVDDGYKEFDLADGKELKVFKGLKGATHAVERLPDGRTILGGRGGLAGMKHGCVVLDTNDAVIAKLELPGFEWIRHLRTTVRGTLIVAAAGRVGECGLDGTIVWSAPVPGNNFKAVELDAERVLVSCGPGGRTLREIDHTGRVLRTLDGAGLKEGAFCGFQRLKNGNLVVANWLGHGSNHDWQGLFEYDAEGKVVWSFGVKQSSFVEVIVLDGLDTQALHAQQTNAVLAPWGAGTQPAAPHLFPLILRDSPEQEMEARSIAELHAQFEMLEALRSGKRPSSRFATPELTHRAESLVGAADRDPVDMVLRRTAALLRDLQRMGGVRDLSGEQRSLETLREESRRVATTDVPSRQILHLKCCELRRRIAFANPLLDFDRILFVTHERNRRGELGGDHMAGQYYGIHATGASTWTAPPSWPRP